RHPVEAFLAASPAGQDRRRGGRRAAAVECRGFQPAAGAGSLEMPGKMWGGRFSGDTDALVERLNNSLAFDQRLWPYDIEGSIAHATMLGEQGIIPQNDAVTIVAALNRIAADLESGHISLDPAAEDVHTAVELLLR